MNTKTEQKERIAVPLMNGMLSMHFGHAEKFAILDVENGAIVKHEALNPPPHEPGSIPKWLNELGATKIIAGGIGQGAIAYFKDFGVTVLSGAPAMDAESLISAYVKNEIQFAGGVCSHSHEPC